MDVSGSVSPQIYGVVSTRPRLFFMHFWAHGNAVTLAKGVKAALSHIALARG